MKKSLLIGMIAFTGIAYSQNVTIPDMNFKSALVSDFSINTNQDFEIQISEASAYLGALSVPAMSIQDLTGIEAFVNIQALNITSNNITTADLSANISLTMIDCMGNGMTSLTLPASPLQVLNCQDNNLTSLDLTPCPGLIQVACFDNDLTSIDLSNSMGLASIQCHTNNLTSLDFSACGFIQVVECYGNQLTNINVSSSSQLGALACDDNLLTSVDVSQNPALIAFSCSENAITQLDVSNNTNLEILWCANTQITDLDVSGNASLEDLDVRNNPALNTLNVANGNNTNFLSFLATSTPQLTCIEVDDEAWSTTNWTDVDSQVSFSEDCAALASLNEYTSASIKVSPNPVQNMLHIDEAETMREAIIFDMFGAIVQKEYTSSFSVENLPSGVYMIHVKTESGMARERFVKK